MPPALPLEATVGDRRPLYLGSQLCALLCAQDLDTYTYIIRVDEYVIFKLWSRMEMFQLGPWGTTCCKSVRAAGIVWSHSTALSGILRPTPSKWLYVVCFAHKKHVQKALQGHEQSREVQVVKTAM